MIIASETQFHVYLPWGQCPFSIVSSPWLWKPVVEPMDRFAALIDTPSLIHVTTTPNINNNSPRIYWLQTDNVRHAPDVPDFLKVDVWVGVSSINYQDTFSSLFVSLSTYHLHCNSRRLMSLVHPIMWVKGRIFINYSANILTQIIHLGCEDIHILNYLQSYIYIDTVHIRITIHLAFALNYGGLTWLQK